MQIEIKDYFIAGLKRVKPIIEGHFKKRDIHHTIDVAEILDTLEKGNALKLKTEVLYDVWEAISHSSLRYLEVTKVRDTIYSLWEYKKFTE